MMYPDSLVSGPQPLWLRFPLPAIWSRAWLKGRVAMVVLAISGYAFVVFTVLAVTFASAEKSTAKTIAAILATASLLASIVAAKLAFSSIDLSSKLRPFVELPRLWGFMLSFSWCALVSVWVGGALPDIASSYFDASGANFFNSWAYPILGNCTIIFSPFVGMIIDKFGWPLPSTLFIIVTQLCLLLLLVESAVAQYFTLIFFNLVQAVGNTLLFSYLQLTFPKDAFPELLALTLSVTGLFGFIAWPGLATNPFSSWTPIIVMLLLPTILLFWWPLHEINLMKAKKTGFCKTENLSHYGSI